LCHLFEQVNKTANAAGWSGVWVVPAMFGQIGDKCCRQIANVLRPREFRAGDYVIRTGDQGLLKDSSLWFVNDGTVTVEVSLVKCPPTLTRPLVLELPVKKVVFEHQKILTKDRIR
jgi:hypothetical protein